MPAGWGWITPNLLLGVLFAAFSAMKVWVWWRSRGTSFPRWWALGVGLMFATLAVEAVGGGFGVAVPTTAAAVWWRWLTLAAVGVGVVGMAAVIRWKVATMRSARVTDRRNREVIAGLEYRLALAAQRAELAEQMNRLAVATRRSTGGVSDGH